MRQLLRSRATGGALRRVCLLLALGALTPTAVAGQSVSSEVGLPVGTPGPAAEVQDLDGNPVELLDFTRGKPALIEFWAVWCANCAALQPQMSRIREAYGDRLNIVAVAVAVSQSLPQVKRHVEEHDAGYPFLWDAQGAAVRAYEASTTSVVVILDDEGRVAYTGIGSGQDLEAAVARVFADG